MLQEILLSLSGHPSPLLRPDSPHLGTATVIPPPEQQLLSTAAHLSDLHIKIQSQSNQVSAEHASTVCRAVATAIESIHLAAFRCKVLEVEESILSKSSDLVGAYSIVPLTAVMGEFSGWTRRLEWLWKIVQFITEGHAGRQCHGAELIDKLRTELQSGYIDIEHTARSLIAAAETAWLKQVSAWLLYGQLPSFGGEDFFIQRTCKPDQDCVLEPAYCPSFVADSTAASILFIGKSLNHVRVKRSVDAGFEGLDHLASHLKELSALTYPIHTAAFSRAVTTIRVGLSRRTLQKLLPLSKVVETLSLLQEFFLLGRGEFAVALTQQADAKLRSRWKRADNLAYEKREGLGTFAVKEGEVTAALTKTWAAMGLMQGQHAQEDESLELARELFHLQLTKLRPDQPISVHYSYEQPSRIMSTTPFRNLLFSVPVILTMEIPSPLDMFLTTADMQIYSAVNSYLLSIRRAHIRLTDLWKLAFLRRHHPPPPGPPNSSTRGGQARVRLLRQRQASRSRVLRNTWATANAAVFFLSETEAYLQTEVVGGLWDGFHAWLVSHEGTRRPAKNTSSLAIATGVDTEDIWLAHSTSESRMSENRSRSSSSFNHLRRHYDPQSLAAAHSRYLATLTHRLLLTASPWTESLYALLIDIDHLVALVHRLQGVWMSMDLEADAGVVDAFVDLENEENDVIVALRNIELKVKLGVREAIATLRSIENDPGFGDNGDGACAMTTAAIEGKPGDWTHEGRYLPKRSGGPERLLMKLDFGAWFGDPSNDDALY